MIDTTKPIQLFDDTGKRENFDVTKILYEDDDVILVEAFNNRYNKNLKFLIDKMNNEVNGNNLLFFYAKNV